MIINERKEVNGWVKKICDINEHNFFYRWNEKRKIRKELKHIAPSFSYLQFMADAIIDFNAYFLYPNIDSNDIRAKCYKTKNFLAYVREIKVRKEKGCIIIIKTYLENYNKKMISIEIDNNGVITSKIVWEESKSDSIIGSKYDKLLFLMVENTLMDKFTDLIMRYIK